MTNMFDFLVCETWQCVDNLKWAMEAMSVTVLIVLALFARSYYRLIRNLVTGKE